MNKLFLIFLFLTLFSCNEEQKLGFLELTDLSNYTITKTKINDSITIIKGTGKGQDYTIKGALNTKHNVKTGWWNVKSESRNEEIKIEYLFFDNKVIMNQRIVYLNGKIHKSFSKYYTKKYENNGFKIDVHFQPSEFKTYSVKFYYTISDSIKKMKIKTRNINLVKNGDLHSCFIPIKENEFISGVVSNASKLVKKDSVYFSVNRMYPLILKR